MTYFETIFWNIFVIFPIFFEDGQSFDKVVIILSLCPVTLPWISAAIKKQRISCAKSSPVFVINYVSVTGKNRISVTECASGAEKMFFSK
jgi:hypothetical protein